MTLIVVLRISHVMLGGLLGLQEPVKGLGMIDRKTKPCFLLMTLV